MFALMQLHGTEVSDTLMMKLGALTWRCHADRKNRARLSSCPDEVANRLTTIGRNPILDPRNTENVPSIAEYISVSQRVFQPTRSAGQANSASMKPCN